MYSLTSLSEPSDDLSKASLSEAQKEAFGVVSNNKDLYEKLGAPLKHGIIVVGAWGSGKSQLIRTLVKEGLVLRENVFERGRIYEYVTKDIELSKSETLERVLEGLLKRATLERGFPAIALDNPDVPTGSPVTPEGAIRFTRFVLEQATFGKTPYLIITVNDFTYKILREEPQSMAKITQHFDVVTLEWSSIDLEKAIINRISIGAKKKPELNKELIKQVSDLARTPRAALFLYLRLLAQGSVAGKVDLLKLVANEGLLPSFEEYIRLLSRPRYALSKAHGKGRPSPRWIDVWRGIFEAKTKGGLTTLSKLIEGEATSKDIVKLAKQAGYKVKHWVLTPPIKYGIVIRRKPGYYELSDEFLAAAVDRAAGMKATAEDVLMSMAELYGMRETGKR